MSAELVIYGAGPRDPFPLDPASMQFKAEPVSRQTCSRCLFEGQWSKVCFRAGEVAKRAGLPDCALGFIYVAASSRQLELLSGAKTGATAEAPDQIQT
jgi:hypothetical protein